MLEICGELRQGEDEHEVEEELQAGDADPVLLARAGRVIGRGDPAFVRFRGPRPSAPAGRRLPATTDARRKDSRAALRCMHPMLDDRPRSRTPAFGIAVTPTADDHAAIVAQVLAAERGGLELVGIQDHPYQRRFLIRSRSSRTSSRG